MDKSPLYRTMRNVSRRENVCLLRNDNNLCVKNQYEKSFEQTGMSGDAIKNIGDNLLGALFFWSVSNKNMKETRWRNSSILQHFSSFRFIFSVGVRIDVSYLCRFKCFENHSWSLVDAPGIQLFHLYDLDILDIFFVIKNKPSQQKVMLDS